MNKRLTVNRAERYLNDLQAVHDYIEPSNPDAAIDMLLHIDDQVDALADPNSPRRLGRVPGTLELVARPNCVLVLAQTDTTVTVLSVMHVARQFP